MGVLAAPAERALEEAGRRETHLDLIPGTDLGAVGKRIVVSGVETTRRPDDGPKRYSLIQNAVIVTNCDPSVLTPAKKGSR